MWQKKKIDIHLFKNNSATDRSEKKRINKMWGFFQKVHNSNQMGKVKEKGCSFVSAILMTQTPSTLVCEN